MIIIEGCDNTGKTTLLKQLCARIPELTFIPHGPRPPVNYSDYFMEMLEVLTKEEIENVIVDRFYFSELVYGPILRGKVGLTVSQIDMLDDILRKINPLIILCFGLPSEIKHTFNDREQLTGVENNIEHIQQKFFSLFNGKNSYRYLEVYAYNWQETPVNGLDDLIIQIKGYLRRKKDEYQ